MHEFGVQIHEFQEGIVWIKDILWEAVGVCVIQIVMYLLHLKNCLLLKEGVCMCSDQEKKRNPGVKTAMNKWITGNGNKRMNWSYTSSREYLSPQACHVIR